MNYVLLLGSVATALVYLKPKKQTGRNAVTRRDHRCHCYREQSSLLLFSPLSLQFIDPLSLLALSVLHMSLVFQLSFSFLFFLSSFLSILSFSFFLSQCFFFLLPFLFGATGLEVFIEMWELSRVPMIRQDQDPWTWKRDPSPLGLTFGLPLTVF